MPVPPMPIIRRAVPFGNLSWRAANRKMGTGARLWHAPSQPPRHDRAALALVTRESSNSRAALGHLIDRSVERDFVVLGWPREPAQLAHEL